jgi:hypothetical protein
MYRRIADRTWLTTAASEGWAHYLGSHLVDRVYAQEGPDLWPDNYNYIEDGTYRLRQQLGRGTNSATLEGARLWSDLGDILDPRDFNELFKAWGKLGQTPGHEALKSALLLQSSDSRLRDWWDRAAPVLLENVQASTVSTKRAERKDLLNQTKELFHDDNQPAGKRSLAGGGHAVRFEIGDSAPFLTAVRIHGSRYGAPQAPAEEFSVWLCDKDFKAIEQFRFPYGRFARGEAAWVELPVEPISLPRTFFICVGFNPTATKGVYVSHDAKGQGTSVMGLPGKTPRTFSAGDWMIRAKIDKKN